MSFGDRFLAKYRAYQATFSGRVDLDFGRGQLLRLVLQLLVSRRASYRLTFQGGLNRPHPPGAEVLADLRRLANIDAGGIVTSPVSREVDAYATCYRAGLRDAYLRIVKYLGLTEAEAKEIANARSE